MQMARLDHLVLTVADVERTVEWYVRVLGMHATTFGEGRRALVFGEQKINLHPLGAQLAPHAGRPTPGSADLCLITVEPIASVRRATGPITSLYIRDPDGNLIEISTYA